MKSKQKYHIVNLFIISFIIFFSNFSYSSEKIDLIIKNNIFHVEVARVYSERQNGLMNRKYLPENEGMLFVFEYMRHASFWMKNTQIKLDIAFIDKDGIITEIKTMKPYSLKSVRSTYKILYALELNKGILIKIGAIEGDKVIFPKGFK